MSTEADVVAQALSLADSGAFLDASAVQRALTLLYPDTPLSWLESPDARRLMPRFEIIPMIGSPPCGSGRTQAGFHADNAGRRL
jgi:hypothetical protein